MKVVCQNFAMNSDFVKYENEIAHFIVDNFEKIKTIVEKGNYEHYEEVDNGRLFKSKIYDFLETSNINYGNVGYIVLQDYKSKSTNLVHIEFFEGLGA